MHYIKNAVGRNTSNAFMSHCVTAIDKQGKKRKGMKKSCLDVSYFIFHDDILQTELHIFFPDYGNFPFYFDLCVKKTFFPSYIYRNLFQVILEFS